MNQTKRLKLRPPEPVSNEQVRWLSALWVAQRDPSTLNRATLLQAESLYALKHASKHHRRSELLSVYAK